jgi:hypothetical protein
MDRTEQRPSFRNWSTKADIVWIALLILLLFGVAHYSDLERGMTAACSGGAIVVLTRFVAYLWARTWFWVLVALFAALHVFVVIYLPWARNDYPAIVLMPFGIVDFGIMYVCVRLVERILD